MKKNGIIIILLGIIFAGCYFGYNKYKQLKIENNRLSNNYLIINQQKDSIIGKNGELHYTINTLELKKSELEKTNSQLVSDIKTMKVKLKNVENITSTNLSYQFKQDSLTKINSKLLEIIENKSDSINKIYQGIKVFNTNYTNNYITTQWKSVINNHKNTLEIFDYQCEIYDSLLYITEIEYKGFWFWRKPKNLKLHIKSNNPYSKINTIQNIRLTK